MQYPGNMIRYLSYNKSLLGVQETNVRHRSNECVVFGIHVPLLVVHKLLFGVQQGLCDLLS